MALEQINYKRLSNKTNAKKISSYHGSEYGDCLLLWNIAV